MFMILESTCFVKSHRIFLIIVVGHVDDVMILYHYRVR